MAVRRAGKDLGFVYQPLLKQADTVLKSCGEPMRRYQWAELRLGHELRCGRFWPGRIEVRVEAGD